VNAPKSLWIAMGVALVLSIPIWLIVIALLVALGGG
jgi:hypothetical protein